jgi:hypothetical protein
LFSLRQYKSVPLSTGKEQERIEFLGWRMMGGSNEERELHMADHGGYNMYTYVLAILSAYLKYLNKYALITNVSTYIKYVNTQNDLCKIVVLCMSDSVSA